MFDAVLFESCVGGFVRAMAIASILLLEFWFLCGVVLDAFWDPLGVLGVFLWGLLGVIWDSFGSSFGPSGTPLGSRGGPLGIRWCSHEAREASWDGRVAFRIAPGAVAQTISYILGDIWAPFWNDF